MTPFEEADARLGAMHGYEPMLSVEADRLLAFMGLVYRGMVGIEIEIPPRPVHGQAGASGMSSYTFPAPPGQVLDTSRFNWSGNVILEALDRYGRRETQAEFRRRALLEAFWRVRRDVWDAREARLRAKWESYG